MATLPWYGAGGEYGRMSPWGNPSYTAGPVAQPAGPGNLTGTATAYSPTYGGKPVVPSPVASAGGAISGNLANLGQLYNLAGSVNQEQQQALLGQYEAAGLDIPSLTATSGKNIADLQHGIIPPDVVNKIIETAAERGVATGAPGGPNANAALLSAMGLTSLDLMGRGEQELTAAIGRTPTAPIFQPQSMMVTPDAIQQAQMASNLYAAAPVPAAAAENELALARAGMGSAPTGGAFSPIIRGGTPPGTDALGFPIPNMGGGGYPVVPTYSGGGGAEPTGDPYANWRNLASTWAGAGTPSGIDFAGLTPEEEAQFLNAPPTDYTGDEEAYYSDTGG